MNKSHGQEFLLAVSLVGRSPWQSARGVSRPNERYRPKHHDTPHEFRNRLSTTLVLARVVVPWFRTPRGNGTGVRKTVQDKDDWFQFSHRVRCFRTWCKHALDVSNTLRTCLATTHCQIMMSHMRCLCFSVGSRTEICWCQEPAVVLVSITSTIITPAGPCTVP